MARSAQPNAADPQAEVPATTRRSEVIVGLLLIAAFALAGLWLSSGSAEEVAVLVARDDIARGEVIDAARLRVVELPADARLAAIAEHDAAQLIGETATSAIAAGSLVTLDAIATDAGLAPGNAIVGLALPPGRYSAATLTPGDTVRVVRHVPADPGAAPTVEVLIGGATVVDVARPGTQGDLLVSLAMPVGEADLVAAATAEDRVSLILVASTKAER